MPLTTLRHSRGVATISNEYLATLFTPNDLRGGVDYVHVIFNAEINKEQYEKLNSMYDKKVLEEQLPSKIKTNKKMAKEYNKTLTISDLKNEFLKFNDGVKIHKDNFLTKLLEWYCSTYTKFDLVDELINQGANKINNSSSPNALGLLALNSSKKANDLLLKWLNDNPELLNKRDRCGKTILMYAMNNKNEKTALNLLDLGASLSIYDNDDNSALNHLFIHGWTGNLSFLSYFIDKCIKENFFNHSLFNKEIIKSIYSALTNNIYLIDSIDKGKENISNVFNLLDKIDGLRINDCSSVLEHYLPVSTVLKILRFDCQETIDWLKKKSWDFSNEILFEQSIKYKSKNLIGILLSLGVDPNKRDENGMTALMNIAATQKTSMDDDTQQIFEIIDLLIKNGADISLKTTNNKLTLLDLAEKATNEETTAPIYLKLKAELIASKLNKDLCMKKILHSRI